MEIKLDPISEKIGTGINNIRIFKNFIEEEDRLALIEYCNSKATQKTGNIFYPIPNSNELRHLHIKYSKKMFANISDFYNDKSPIRKQDFPENDYDTSWNPDMESGKYIASFLIHPTGSFMFPHVDIVGYVQKEGENVPDHLNKWSGHLSSVIYLNDNYEGGELYFPDHNLEIKPEAGDYITWPGNRWYQHGVKEVTGGLRYTLSTWVRFEEAYGKEIYSYGSEK
jgi:hypothetical protein